MRKKTNLSLFSGMNKIHELECSSVIQSNSIEKMINKISWDDEAFGACGAEPEYQYSLYKLFIKTSGKLWLFEYDLDEREEKFWKYNYFEGLKYNKCNVMEGNVRDVLNYKHHTERKGLDFIMTFLTEAYKQEHIHKMTSSFPSGTHLRHA